MNPHATRQIPAASPDSRGPFLELDLIAQEIDDDLLAFASDGAREEWVRFKATCAEASAQPRRPFGSEDELAILVGKARRFRAVLLLSS